MIPATSTLMAAASRNHAPRWRVALDDGTLLGPLALSGSIRKESSREHRTTITLDTATQGKPSLLDQRLLPAGAWLRAEWRIHPLPETLLVDDCPLIGAGLQRPASQWAHEAMSPSALIAGDELDSLLWTSTPATVGALVTAIVNRTFPAAVVSITGPAATAAVPADLEVAGDPWKVVQEACTSCGAEVLFRPDRSCVVRPQPVIGTPVDHLKVGAGGTITGYDFDHERAYSAVYLEYQDKDGNVIRIGRWYDTRPDSPTSVDRIGRKVYREVSKAGLSPTQAEADAAAAALGVRTAGRGRRVVVRHIPRPWLEPGDTVAVTFSGGPTELHLIESVDIPIGPGVQVTALRNSDYVMEA